MLKFGVNLMYRFYSGQWIDDLNFNVIPEDIKQISKKLCGVDIFANNFRFPDNWINSVFSDILFRPESPAKTYYPPKTLKEDIINFPFENENQQENEISNKTSNEIKILYNKTKQNPDALLMLLQKYGSFIPISKNNPISLYEHIKFLEAIHQCGNSFLFALADFSGIQNFIYTISSKGALKSLRARSFFLSLLSEHLIYEILKKENINRSSIIFSGGGSFYLLLPQSTKETLVNIKEKINSYFLHIGGKLYLGFVWSECNIDDLMPPNFRHKWNDVDKLLEEDKNKKFSNKLQEIFTTTIPKKLTSQEECQICHRDDINIMEEIEDHEGNKMNACHLCKELFYLGDALTKYEYINRWEKRPTKKGHFIEIPSLKENAYYWVGKKPDGTFNWIKNSFQPGDYWPFFTADYVTLENGKTADFESLADKSEGKKLIGCLRMDVDNLGVILSQRINSDLFSPLILSTLSKSVNLFFTIYMNLICKKKIDNPLLIPIKNREKERVVSIIYSGGDDLVIIGAWNEICEISLDIRRNFKKYVKNNEDISISGGIFLAHPKFPLYQMISFSGKAEEIAKRNYSECTKEECCQNYQSCYFYEPEDIPKCKRKDSVFLFYSPLRESKKKRLNKEIKTEGRIKTSLKWDEIECKVICPLKIMYPVFTDKAEGKIFSRSLIYRFFTLLDKWENDGILYLPLMSWSIERLKKLANTETSSQIADLSSILFNIEYMSSLYIPLTWLDLLKR